MKLTLCGSRRFEDKFHYWSEKLAFAGHVVYGLAVWDTRPDPDDKAPDSLTDEQKVILDQVHFAKIDNSDGIVVINVDGYIGTSTKNEIRWAKIKGKEIYFVDEEGWNTPELQGGMHVSHIPTLT